MDIISILIGGGIFAFIEFLINRHDNKADKNSKVLAEIEKLSLKITTLEDKIDNVAQTGDKRNAVEMRVRILHFRDEMLEGRNHTHDSFQQVLSDIDEYEEYCKDHPDFKNNQTVATIEHIKRSYAERLEKHDFL